MRVLLISHTCQSRTEGQPKARYLARARGVDLKVLIPDRWKHYGKWRLAEPPAPGDFESVISRVALPWVGPAQFYLHWYPILPNLIKEFRPDIIDLWEEPWGMVSAHACRMRDKFLPGCKVISETEQNIDKSLPFPFENFRRYTIRHADFVVGRNTESVEILRRKGYTGPAEVVPNAVDENLFRPLNRDKCRKELGVDGFVAGYVGRFVEEKGLADLVEAVARCPANVRLLLVGSGPFEPAIRKLANDRGISNRLTILAAKPLEELPRVMNALDVLVLPSRTTRRWREQFGRVIIEANSCSIPVIGSNSGAIPDVVGSAGVIVPEANPAGLADALITLAADPDRCRAMGEAGRAQVEAHYTWERVADRMASIYRKVMAGSVNSPAHPIR